MGGAMFFWSDTHYSISLRYTRNIVQLNSIYIKIDSKPFFIYIINTITNWQVSLSKICHSWPNNVVTHSCAARIRELLRYMVIRDINNTRQLSPLFISTCNFLNTFTPLYIMLLNISFLCLKSEVWQRSGWYNIVHHNKAPEFTPSV